MLSRNSLLLLGFCLLTLLGLHLSHGSPALIFAVATAAMFPLGTALARASESLAHHFGPGPASLLNATLGNAPELVILFLTLDKGLLSVVKATISGSLLCNLLLINGLAAVVGGLRYKFLKLNPIGIATNMGTLSLVVAALLVPAMFASIPHPHGPNPLLERTRELSVGVSVVLICVYVMSVIFSLWTHREDLNDPMESVPGHVVAPVGRSLAWIAGCMVVVVVVSDQLVDAAENLVKAYHLSGLFLGVVGLALVGNAADYAVAVQMAWHNKVDLAFRIGTGAAIQVALFVAPVLVLGSQLMAHPLDLRFSPLEVLSIALAVMAVTMHSRDDAFTWFEGAQLVALYLIIAFSFFFY